MIRRLMLGCGSVGHTLVEQLRESHGELQIITADPGWATTLRESNVRAAEGDPADPAGYPERADLIVVASDSPERNLAAVEAANSAFPEATIVAYTGENATVEARSRIAAVADELINPVDALAGRVLDAGTGEGGERMAALLGTLRRLSGPLAVVAHDNPDPDAIASAIGLARIAELVGVPAEPCYHGDISHQENRALVNLLDLPLRHVESLDIDQYGGIALVDHSRPGVNDSLPEDTPIDIVVDHHPPRGPVEATYVDIRAELGSTSTIIAEYCDRLGREPDRQLATALLYGIRVDTREFTREVSVADFEAATDLLRVADADTLKRVESPSFSADTVDTLARAIRRRDVRGSTLATCVGRINDRDALSQAADRLLDIEDITISFVYGFREGTVYASARARGTDVDLGELLREALGQIGSAGGHADMAGAQVPLGILANVDGRSEETLTDVVEDIISGRFFETLGDAPSAPVADVDASDFPSD